MFIALISNRSHSQVYSDHVLLTQNTNIIIFFSPLSLFLFSFLFSLILYHHTVEVISAAYTYIDFVAAAVKLI